MCGSLAAAELSAAPTLLMVMCVARSTDMAPALFAAAGSGFDLCTCVDPLATHSSPSSSRVLHVGPTQVFQQGCPRAALCCSAAASCLK